jgi:hypothetical protein
MSLQVKRSLSITPPPVFADWTGDEVDNKPDLAAITPVKKDYSRKIVGGAPRPTKARATKADSSPSKSATSVPSGDYAGGLFAEPGWTPEKREAFVLEMFVAGYKSFKADYLTLKVSHQHRIS